METEWSAWRGSGHTLCASFHLSSHSPTPLQLQKCVLTPLRGGRDAAPHKQAISGVWSGKCIGSSRICI